MFYEENKVNKLIICPYCKLKYTDPRIIECGASFCMTCIDLFTRNGENGFKCPVCNDFHQEPKKGFVKNSNLAELCAMQANEVSRGLHADISKRKLFDLKQNLDHLATKNKVCVERIQEHCDQLRNEVQLSSEQLIQSIKTHSMDLIEQINAYERNSKLDFKQENKAQFDSFISQTYKFHKKWVEYLKRSKLNDTDLMTASAEASKCLEQVKSENEQVLAKVFNGNVLQFDKNPTRVESSLIGALSFKKKFSASNFSKNLSNLKAHELPRFFNHHNTFHNHGLFNLVQFKNNNQPILAEKRFKFLDDDKILLAYNEPDCMHLKPAIKIQIFDNNLNILHERLCKTGRLARKFKLNAMANKSIVLCLINSNQSSIYYGSDSDGENTLSALSVIKLFDEKLRKLKTICLNYAVICMDTFENQIYCLSGEGQFSTIPPFVLMQQGFNNGSIYVYDSDLVFLKRIGQTDPSIPFYIPYSVGRMQVSASYYVLFDTTEILFMDKHDGQAKKKLKTENKEFLLNSFSNSMITYNNCLYKVFSCDIDEERLQEYGINISSPNNQIKLVDCFNEKLLFLDESSNCLYF